MKGEAGQYAGRQTIGTRAFNPVQIVCSLWLTTVVYLMCRSVSSNGAVAGVGQARGEMSLSARGYGYGVNWHLS